MKITAYIVTIVCCCLMFFVKREWKAALLVMGSMTLTLVNVPAIPLHKANFLLPASFLLSELPYLKYHLAELRSMPLLKKLLLLACVSTAIAAFTTTYTSPSLFLRTELFFKYFAIAYAFWTIKDEESLKPILYVSMFCLIVLTLFGIANYLTKNADFINALTNSKTSLIKEDIALGDFYAESKRFRVQSMFKSPFDYGYTCAIILLLHIYAWFRGQESKSTFVIVLVCSLFGILFCECRIVLVSLILSVSCFYMWNFPLSKIAVAGILFLCAFTVSYSSIDFVENKVNKLSDALVENNKTGGSSIQMRASQFLYVRHYTEGHELLGLGNGYWAYNFAEDQDSVEGLLGIESVILGYLLERGIIGLALWAIFYSILFRYFWRNRQKVRTLTALGASILTAYLLFSIGTGELGSVYPTLLLLGFAIKAIESAKAKEKCIN